MGDRQVLRELSKALGERSVLRGQQIGDAYLEDVLGNRGESPLAVLRPTDTGEVSRALAICNAAGVPVVTQGGRTGLALGALPRSGEIVLSLERMNRIESIDLDGATATVQAGVILQALQERLEPLGMMFPLDLGGRGSCTIGGNIATNAGGNRVIRYGMTRELVIGLEAVLADGTVLNGLKSVIKNNTGLDLKQLFIGSEGAYGVVTRAVVRLLPLPTDRLLALCTVNDFTQVRALLRLARDRLAGDLTAFEVMWSSYAERALRTLDKPPPITPGKSFYVLVEVSGTDVELLSANFERALHEAMEKGIVDDAVIAKSGVEASELWRIRDMAIEVSRQIDPIVPFDISVAIGDMERFTGELAAAVRSIDTRCEIIVFGHVGDGNLHIAVHQPPDRPGCFRLIEQSVYRLVGEYGGSISAEHGIGCLKREFLVHSRSAEEIAMMRRIKIALDPRGTLNRDRIFALLTNPFQEAQT